ncbi:hypothetical protein H0H93_012778 [Arthromyces matolae]|nr:hypothetical protein H0H93_012778 [Arthromyces matolae]
MTGVSTDIGASFVRPAGRVGDVLHAKAVLTGMGKSLAYTRVDFTNPAGELVAYGYHTKYIGKSSSHHKNVKFSEDGKDVIEGEFDDTEESITFVSGQQKTATMDDELSALPPEEPHKKLHRLRTSSAGIRSAYAPSVSPVSTRAGSPLRYNAAASSSTTAMQRSTLDRLEILAPTPRRHLLDTTVSQRWLRTPPHSPVSSRAASPASTVASVRGSRHHFSSTASFSALLEHEHSMSGVRSSRTNVDDTSMAKRAVRWMHRRNMRTWLVPIAIGAAVLVKAVIGLGSYSGMGTPPMYGDYEAQRHWMELTLHLPFRQWYTYDLQYWGLDYPPLTAYVSWVCGLVGSFIQPSWFALDASRGIETEGSKVFMRSTVIAFDLLVYVPALVMFVGTWLGTRSKRTQHGALKQYSLGFTLLALNFFATGQDLLGAVCFVCSLCFKQMALYYAPAIGSYLLAKCISLGPTNGTTLFIRLAAVTVITFILFFLPFLPPFVHFSTIFDPITRIFPFARGLFEDKVANFWCASNVVFKWKNWASTTSLIRLSTALTALGFLPGAAMLLQAGYQSMVQGTEKTDNAVAKASQHTSFLSLLPYALLNSSMSFFLFSFQVHEKTILLPLLPMTLLLSGAHADSAVYSWGVLVNNVAVFSMWPLLKRDGLGIQYIATLLLWNRLVGNNPFRVPRKSFIEIVSACSVFKVMLSTTAPIHRFAIAVALRPPLLVVRTFATESVHSTPGDLPPPPPPSNLPNTSSKPRQTSLYLRPRPAISHNHSTIPPLPPTFGRNQLLPVPDSTRALLEAIVSQFDAPIRYAFAYGSGVFEQDGYDSLNDQDKPMLDFIFAVTHPAHFHSINMHQHPNHYPLHARLLGSSYVSRLEAFGPGVWFNPYVSMGGVRIKYGITTVDNLCSDLLNWNSLYLAGRMHKPLRIIKDDARVRLTQQVNLTSAVRAALLTLPHEFPETHLFERIAGISYNGDPRMWLPAENRGKVTNIVRKQGPQFKELYHRLAVGLPGIHWPIHETTIRQDTSPMARAALLKKLPSNLLHGVREHYSRNTGLSIEADEVSFWNKLAADEQLPQVLTNHMGQIVRYPAAVQSVKGIASAGLGKSMRYSVAKVKKWWAGS